MFQFAYARNRKQNGKIIIPIECMRAVILKNPITPKIGSGSEENVEVEKLKSQIQKTLHLLKKESSLALA